MRGRLSDAGVALDKYRGDPSEPLQSSELGRALLGSKLGLKAAGTTIGERTREDFAALVQITESYDALVNRSIGEGLKQAGLIDTFQTEKSFGRAIQRRSDIYCEAGTAKISLELMWRSSTTRAQVADYLLRKLYNYGEAMGLLGPADSSSAS